MLLENLQSQDNYGQQSDAKTMAKPWPIDAAIGENWICVCGGGAGRRLVSDYAPNVESRLIIFIRAAANIEIYERHTGKQATFTFHAA